MGKVKSLVTEHGWKGAGQIINEIKKLTKKQKEKKNG